MARPRLGPHGTSGARALLLCIALFAAILAVAPRAIGAPGDCYVSGPISSTTSWPLPGCIRMVMTGNVTVMPSVELTIQPGLSVLADPAVFLYVEGTLIADGTPDGPIAFAGNSSVLAGPWGGLQFNATADRSSVSWSTFSGVERAVTAVDSSPWIHDNTVISAAVGFAFVNSASVVEYNTVRQAGIIGIYVNASDASIVGNAINNTSIGIQVEQPGMPWIWQNTITNVTGGFAAGIFVQKDASAQVYENSILGVRGSNGGSGGAPGAPGRDGGPALGVYVLNAPSATVSWNTIETVIGGNGGNGRENTSGLGGRGGNGGPAAGIVVAGGSDVTLQGNAITAVRGGRGGNGGGSAGTTNGGRGGDAGEAAGIEVAFTTNFADLSGNTIDGVTGGGGGSGGDGLQDGSGGFGGDAYGAFFISAAQTDISGNPIENIRGGFGGNSTVSSTPGDGAPGGDATGISVFSVVGSSVVHSNWVDALTGGQGGTGRSGGSGGNATGLVALGNNDGLFNVTTITSNGVTNLLGGAGGNGRSSAGGAGGSATGIGALFVTPTFDSNFILSAQGGSGGNSVAGTGGRGGDAAGLVGGLLSNGQSSNDEIVSVTKGGPGSPGSPPPAYARGLYFIGDAATTTGMIVENGTIESVGDFDFYIDNYTEAVALNTPFTTLSVQAAGNLTVQNYLDVRVLWPNEITLVAGANVRVEDDGAVVWDQVTATGLQSWIVVTDRVYINENDPTDHETIVTVSFEAYSFLTNDRSVDMGTSHEEPFIMVDESAPTSAAIPLPTYRNTLTFTVGYTASDGDGTGLRDVTLWYRTGGSGGWTEYATKAAGLEGQFTFTAPAEGVYEFATTVDDTSGNTQPGPSENHTWTIVDTTRPGSRIVDLPQYRTTLSFTVTWAPESGVTDIEKYRIEYRTGAGWVHWTTTASTSATFSATADGTYEFRSIAIDRAGNWEPEANANDTWTIVDTIRPDGENSPALGANTSRSPVINIIFTEPMDRDSVEREFSITPATGGTFTWSADSRVLTFVPSGQLAAATPYTVIISSEASDLAGNQILQPLTFQFTTVAAPPTTAFAVGDFWWLFLIVGAVLGGGLLLLMRRRAGTASKPPMASVAPPPPKESQAIVEDLFLLSHRDGLLIKHETRRLRPDVDTDILTGMLTAVQAFVKDALRGDEYGELSEMTVGSMHILIGRGKWLVLAARIEGDGSASWTGQIERCVKDMEDHHWDQLEDWNGDMSIARVLTPYLKKLIMGGYALVAA